MNEPGGKIDATFAEVPVVPFGGLGATVDPKLLTQVKNLCRGCGQYRACVGDCKGQV